MTHPTADLPGWIADLRSSATEAYLRIADDVWADRQLFIRWPQRSLLFIPGLVRPASGFHTYSSEHRELFKAAKLRADTKTNGPAVMAYLLADGERPTRASDAKGWSVHHIYDGQFPAPGRTASTWARNHPDYFTQAAGLVAVHPIADALAAELDYFAWLLRYEAFVRFGFDPDGVFLPVQVG